MDTRARINDNLYLDIRWARANDYAYSNKIAIFSGDMCTNDGTRICTFNRLYLVKGKDEKGEDIYTVSSVSVKLSRGDILYSVNWFPSLKDGTNNKERYRFGKECLKAVTAFQKKSQENIKESSDLKSFRAVSDKIRTITK